MFKHIVLWRLKDHANGKSRVENARLIKERFEELANMLDGLRHLEVGLDVLRAEDRADVALYSAAEEISRRAAEKQRTRRSETLKAFAISAPRRLCVRPPLRARLPRMWI
jgi:hypothetical protein